MSNDSIIRRSDFAGGGITDAERKQMNQISQEWIDIALRTDTVDQAAMTQAVTELYACADLPPPRVVFVESPMVMAFAYGAASAWWEKYAKGEAGHGPQAFTAHTICYSVDKGTRNETMAATDTTVWEAAIMATGIAALVATKATTIDVMSCFTRDQTFDYLYNATVYAMGKGTRNAMDNITYNSTDVATDEAVNDATRDATRNATEVSTRNAIHKAARTATEVSSYNALDNVTLAATVVATRVATNSVTWRVTEATVHDAISDDIIDATRDTTRAAIMAAAMHDSIERDEAERTLKRATYDAVGDSIREATDRVTFMAALNATVDFTYDATIVVTYSATLNAIHDLMNELPHETVEHTVEEQTAMACYAFSGKAGINAAHQWQHNYQGGAYWAGTEAYYCAVRDVFNLDLPAYKKYKPWEDCARLAPFRVVHNKFCIVSNFPETLRMDEKNLPHCEDGPSHRWRDGWELYHWHGQKVPRDWIMHPDELSAAEVLQIENADLRSAAMEIIGWPRILDELDAITIDQDDDPEIGSLVEVTLPDLGKQKFIQAVCGTGRPVALMVPPEMKSVLEAQAWTYDIELDEFHPEFRT